MDVSTPPSSTLPPRRPRDFRVCYDDDNGNNDPTGNTTDALLQPWGVAPIDFLYSIETNFSPLSLSLREKEEILTSVSAAIIESVYEHGCLPQRSRKRRRQSAVSSLLSSSASISRRAEILSISPGIGHEWLGECDGLSSSKNNDNENDSFCNEIQGTVVIAFDGKNHPESTKTVASDFKSVGNVVLSRIEEDMINGNYLDKVKNDMLEFGVTINSMKYIDSDYPDLVAQDAFVSLNTNSGSLEADMVRVNTVDMTLFSKVAIPIMVALSLLAMGFCWCAILSCPTDLFFAKKRITKQESGYNEDEDPYSKGFHNRSQSNLGRDAEKGDNTNSNATDAGMGRKEKCKQEGSKEKLRALSLEATLEDLSVTEKLTYGDQNAVHSMSSGNHRTYSTTPMRNTQSSRSTNRFLPVSVRTRPQSTMRVLDGNSHPSDTETGSSGHSVERNNYMKDRAPARSKVEQNSTPIRVISSFFSKSVASAVPPAPTATINLMDRISSCTSIRNNHCFGDEQELPPSTMMNRNNSTSTVLRYVVPNDERCNSLLDTESPTPPDSRKTMPTTVGSSLPRMGTKKSAAYREYINKKMLEREAECEQLDASIPMEIGVKRTFTDSKGRIREMVAL